MSDIRKFDVDVTISVEVVIDESRFTPAWMAAFRANYYPFDTIEDHVKHLAQLLAREFSESQVEGYDEGMFTFHRAIVTDTEINTDD